MELIPVGLLLIGGWLAFFGVHYWRSDLKYPTDPIKSVLQGKGLPANTATPTAEEQAVSGGAAGAGSAVAKGVQAAGAGSASAAGQSAGSGATAEGNRQLGKMLAATYGWSTGPNWDYLRTGWDAESGWNNRIWNGGSTAPTHANPHGTAYGIPQALPFDKMQKPAWPPGYGGTADPTHQINWGLAYIKATYGAPVNVPFWSANGPLPGYKGY